MQPTQAEAAKDWSRWRPIARRLYLDTNGDIGAARELAPQYARQEYGFAWAMIIAQLMLILFKWWLERNVQDPGPIPMAGEPYGR